MKLMSSFILLIFFLGNAYAQDSILLHNNFLPKHTYNQTVIQKIHMTIAYSGNDSILEKLKDKGMSNPLITDRQTNFNAVITTGPLGAINKMPVRLEFIKAIDKDGNTIIPSGTIMMGAIENGNMPVYDSIISDKMDKDTKAAFLKSFKNILSQLSLPPKKMAVGDTFSVVTPLNFPIGPVSFKMIFTVIYKLMKLDEKTADFAIDIKYKLAMDLAALNASGGGTGKGVMIIDRKNDYPLKYTSSYSMDLKGEKNGLTIHAIFDGSSDNNNVISSQ